MNLISILLLVVASLFTHQATAQGIYSMPPVINALMVAMGSRPLIQTTDDVPVEQDVKIFCANPSSPIPTVTTINDTQLASKLNMSRPVTFLVHGFISNSSVKWMPETATDYLKYVGDNICLVDWGRLANFTYQLAAQRNTKMVGDYLATFIRYLQGNGLVISQTQIVGFSLGAHIAGYAGASLNGQLKRIIGLDPAGPLFSTPIAVDRSLRLDDTDAKNVQVIYATRFLLGLGLTVGHDNFYPNNGFYVQPGCLLPMTLADQLSPAMLKCSHEQGHEYFRYSLNPANRFVAKECPNYFLYTIGFCYFGQNNLMGWYSSGAPGSYMLTTYTTPPFAKGY